MSIGCNSMPTDQTKYRFMIATPIHPILRK
jgi:hypothetical protein